MKSLRTIKKQIVAAAVCLGLVLVIEISLAHLVHVFQGEVGAQHRLVEKAARKTTVSSDGHSFNAAGLVAFVSPRTFSPKRRARPSKRRHAFTLVEIISAVAIVAILSVALIVFTMSYVQWSQSVSDQRTLLVLNDALTRYKCEGGGTTALTAGAPISNVITALKTPVNWAGTTHQFLQSAFTIPARSLSAMGNGSNYCFYMYNTFTSQTPSISTPTSQHPYPYGYGVGYMANGSNAVGYNVTFVTSGGSSWVACKDNNGNITYVASGANPTLPIANSYTFWACAGNGNQTATGTLINLSCRSNQLASLDVSGLTALTSIYCNGGFNQLTSLNLSGLTMLMYLNCAHNQLTTLDVSSCSSLQTLYCDHQLLTSIKANGLSSLSTLECQNNLLGTITITGDYALPATSTDGSTYFQVQSNLGVTIIGP